MSSAVTDGQNDYKAAEDKLNKERATLVAFDNELNDLDKDLKIKKKDIVDSELGLKKAEHDTSLIAKERSSLEVMKENLEKQFSWILEEKQSVIVIRRNTLLTIQLLWESRITIRFQRCQPWSCP
jgi:septal ring factor EnvC (AmiA/AmiB activator)